MSFAEFSDKKGKGAHWAKMGKNPEETIKKFWTPKNIPKRLENNSNVLFRFQGTQKNYRIACTVLFSRKCMIFHANRKVALSSSISSKLTIFGISATENDIIVCFIIFPSPLKSKLLIETGFQPFALIFGCLEFFL